MQGRLPFTLYSLHWNSTSSFLTFQFYFSVWLQYITLIFSNTTLSSINTTYTTLPLQCNTITQPDYHSSTTFLFSTLSSSLSMLQIVFFILSSFFILHTLFFTVYLIFILHTFFILYTLSQLLTQCYARRKYAYVYASPNSVYNVSYSVLTSLYSLLSAIYP